MSRTTLDHGQDVCRGWYLLSADKRESSPWRCIALLFEMFHKLHALWSQLACVEKTIQHLAGGMIVQVKVKTIKRRSRLLFIPAFVFHYHFGESFSANGGRRPEQFQAIVGGLKEASVAAERHFSPAKVLHASLTIEGPLTWGTPYMGIVCSRYTLEQLRHLRPILSRQISW